MILLKNTSKRNKLVYRPNFILEVKCQSLKNIAVYQKEKFFLFGIPLKNYKIKFIRIMETILFKS